MSNCNIHKLVLRTKEGHEQVTKGDILRPDDNDGEFIFTGFSWSSSLASSGKVYVKPVSKPDAFSTSYFPSVFGLEIVAQNKETGEIKELWEL